MNRKLTLVTLIAAGLVASVSAAPKRKFRLPPIEQPRQAPEGAIQPQLKESLALIRATEARTEYSVSGEGFAAAILDTGINAAHVDFVDRIAAQRNFTPDYACDADNATDGNGHGTNVAGIVAARKENPPAVAQGLHTGVAPGARLVALKVLTNAGKGEFPWVESALDWILNNRGKHNITVVNLSLGDGGNYDSDAKFAGERLRKQIQQLRELRVPVVVAAGNEYFRSKRPGMGYPAILAETVSVGAVYDADIGPWNYPSTGAVAYSTATDRITPFSQRLHESVANLTRTDIFAPGAEVTSTGKDGPRGESYQQGTSQAAPMVAGVILLMQQYHWREKHELPTVDNLEKWLRRGARPVVDDCDRCDNVIHTKLSFPRVDARGALAEMIKDIKP